VPPIQGDGHLSWWSAPKLNGIFLYSYLSRHGFRVALVNKYFRERDDFRELLKQDPRAVILSSTFIRSKAALGELAEDIRSRVPGITIIAGGSFVYLSYLVRQRSGEKGYLTQSVHEDLLFFDHREPPVDLYIISLAGEKILCEALARIKAHRPLEDLPNAALFDGEAYTFTERIDDIPDAEPTRVDWDSLPASFFRAGVIPLQTSKGCPHKCAFCNFTRDRRLMFVKPIDSLVHELRVISRRGARYVWFVDDNFRHGVGDLNAICRRFLEAGIDLKWMTMVRADTLKNADAPLLKEAGCIELQLGLESANPQILRNMNKKAHPDLYRRVVRKVLEAGINCSCYFIFGFPGETDETARETLRFIQSLEHPELEGTLSWSLFPFSLYPMSPIYEVKQREKYGLTGYLRDWTHDTMTSDQAMAHVRNAFMALDHSCAVYRGDNLDLLLDLSPGQRKAFLIARHRLSKSALDGPVQREEILRTFEPVVSA
jgi:radical SAM superfamily enzyme YgiQ (UPF0313 family)